MLYRRLSFVTSPENEELLTARLWELGTLGLELRQGGRQGLRIEAYFDEPPAAAVAALAGGGDELAGAELVDSAAVAEADWMAAYRRQARPLPVGRRLVIDPGDDLRPEPPPAGRHVLHLPARRAFGTGSHPSTGLAIELLEQLPLAGRRVLDLGSGTGILAFAALLFGAASVVALDVDPVAAVSAAENARRNRLRPAVAAGSLAGLAPGRRFDLALVNIRPEKIRPELPELHRCLRAGAQAIFSGLLAAEARRVEDELQAAGFVAAARRRHDEWAALLTRLRR